MSLFDLFKGAGKFYITKARCYNCGTVSEIKVPKGQTIDEYIASGEASCPTCKCSTLRRIIVAPKVVTPVKQAIQTIKKIDRAMTPKVPRQMHQDIQEPEYEYQEVRTPLKKKQRPTDVPGAVSEEPVQQNDNYPDFRTPRPKRINMWTGREQRD